MPKIREIIVVLLRLLLLPVGKVHQLLHSALVEPTLEKALGIFELDPMLDYEAFSNSDLYNANSRLSVPRSIANRSEFRGFLHLSLGQARLPTGDRCIRPHCSSYEAAKVWCARWLPQAQSYQGKRALKQRKPECGRNFRYRRYKQ